MGFKSFFSGFGKLIKKAFGYAKSLGLTDDLVQLALKHVRIANDRFVDNEMKREWVVERLVAAGIKESIARLAVELAYRVYRKEVEDKYGV